MPVFSATQLRNCYSSFRIKTNLVLQKSTAYPTEDVFRPTVLVLNPMAKRFTICQVASETEVCQLHVRK
jgi:hypothetical protein